MADAYRGKQDAPYETLIDFLIMRKDKYENIVPIDPFLQSVDPASGQQVLLAKDDDRDIMEAADVQEEDVTPGNLFIAVMTWARAHDTTWYNTKYDRFMDGKGQGLKAKQW